MKIYDSETGEELTEEQADTQRGIISEAMRAKPGAYETIDNVVKFALSAEDYESVLIYRAYTAEDLRAIALEQARAELEQANEEWEEALAALFACTTLTELLKALAQKRGRDAAKRRKELRARIRELAAGDAV